MRKPLYVLSVTALALVLSGCGGGSKPADEGTDTDPYPSVLATATEVADIIEENDTMMVQMSGQLNIVVNCVSLDAEGRRFSCNGEMEAWDGSFQPIASWDAVCDGVRCQWTRYDR